MKKLIIIIVCIFLITGCSVKKVQELTDAEKFATEYNISDNNPFVYATYEEIDNIFNSSGIIFLASPDYSGSQKAAKVLNEVALKNKTDKIYYYNSTKIREKNSKKYKKLVKYLDEYIKKSKDEEVELNLPIIVSVKEGKIIGYSNYFSKESHLSEEKLTKKRLTIIKEEYKKILNYEECSNCT